MKTLTNESKIRFLFQYLGGIVQITSPAGNSFNTVLNYETLHEKYLLHSKLIKTPLQKITDDNAIEVAKLYHPGNDRCEVLRKDNKGYFKIDVDSSSSLEVSLAIELYFNKAYGTSYSSNVHGCEYNSLINELAHISVYQYLQSKGYAMPYYCPIENRIVTVKEQVSEGWIVLKEE
jgi:hypothetical protein